jgi:hypothetical protein
MQVESGLHPRTVKAEDFLLVYFEKTSCRSMNTLRFEKHREDYAELQLYCQLLKSKISTSESM